MNLWFDDSRTNPEGWIWCKNVQEAQKLLLTGKVENASLDHDIFDKKGNEIESGYDLIVWMAKNDIWPKNKPLVHTGNPVARISMQALINQHHK